MARLSDSAFRDLLDAVITIISANLAGYPPLVAGDMTAFGALRDTYKDDLLLHVQQQDAAKAQTITKDASRQACELELRRIRDLIKAHGVSEANLAALGLPTSESQVPNATVPIGSVDTSERLRHTIHFADSAAPNLKRRPRGTIGCEIWRKVDGPPPGDETECSMLTLDTETPHVINYTQADAGKVAHYMLRWQLKGGGFSAWSETISATITG